MEVVSCVKATVAAATQYKNCRSEENEIHLQRQLDVLISITNKGSAVECFDPKQLLYTECLACLVEIMNGQKTTVKPALGQKTLMLLCNLANSQLVIDALHGTFNLMSALATYLRTQTVFTVGSSICQCLKLMQKLSYGTIISAQEVYMEDLVRYLVKQIEGKENEMTPLLIGLLSNLCRNNAPVQGLVKLQENSRQLYKKLISFLSHPNQKIEIFSLSLITSLCLKDDIGEKLMNIHNINQIFQLLFNIIVNNASTSRYYAIRLFIDLMQSEARFYQSLCRYEHINLCMQKVLCLLSCNDSSTVTKILELCLSFCGISALRTVLTDLIINWPDDQQASPLAVLARCASQSSLDSVLSAQLIQQIYEELLISGESKETIASSWTTVLRPVVSSCLHRNSLTQSNIAIKQHVSKYVAIIKLLTMLCYNEGIQRDLLSQIDICTACTSLMENQLAVNRHGNNSDENNRCIDVVNDLVINVLHLMILLSPSSSSMKKSLDDIIKDIRLIPYIASAVLSEHTEQVYVALDVVCAVRQQATFDMKRLADTFAAISKNRISKELSAQPVSQNTTATFTNGFVKDTVSRLAKPAGLKSTASQSSLDASVQAVIDKMQNGLDLRDIRASEIIAIYEHRLQSLQTKENAVQDLLEAKTATLEQSDRLMTQYRSRIAQYEAEAIKLRSLLQEWERRTEDYHDKLSAAVTDRDRLQNDYDYLNQENARLLEIAERHKQLEESYTQQAQRLEAAQRSLTSARQENQSLVEMSEMLKRHLETLRQQHETATKQLEVLEDERKKLSRNVAEKDSKEKELNQIIIKLEERYKKTANDCTELETAVDKLRTELSRAENTKKELQHKVTSLEVVCRQHEMSIKEKDQTITAQKTELDKHAQIAALIHSLSGGKDVPAT